MKKRWLHLAPLVLATVMMIFALPIDGASKGKRGGGGGGSKANVSRSGKSSTGSVRHSGGGRSGRSTAGVQGRKNPGGPGGSSPGNSGKRSTGRASNKREVKSERRENRSERAEWFEDRYKRNRRRVGFAMTIAAFGALTCTPTVVIVNGVAFHSCNGAWYNRRYVGGSVTYVVVTTPPGY